MTTEIQTGKKRHPAAVFWIVVGFLTAAAAMVFALLPGGHATRVIGMRGDPSDAAASFFNALCLREWKTAAWYVRGQPDLGLDRTPEDELEARIWDAFLRSWSWSPDGEERTDETHASQTVRFTYLSQDRLMEGVNEKIRDLLEALVDETEDLSKIYTDDRSFRTDVVYQALRQTVEQRLEKPEDYTVTVPVTVHLVYQNDRWQIEPEESLWRVLSGGEESAE